MALDEAEGSVVDGQSLNGRIAVVTGGGSDLGRAISRALVADGANVTTIDPADLSDAHRLPETFAGIVRELGTIDILVNNAGMRTHGPAVDVTESEWDRAMALNAKALFFCAREAGRHFVEQRKRGKIINSCSVHGLLGEPELATWCATQGAVLQLTRALASEWAQHGINVNAVGAADGDPQLDRLPARALPSPEHIADAVLFLAGPRSDFIHGHMLMVDGGESIV